MTKMTRSICVLLCLLALVLLAGCTAKPLASALSVLRQNSEMPQQEPMMTPEPTFTPEPTPAATPEPTATPEPSPAATPRTQPTLTVEQTVFESMEIPDEVFARMQGKSYPDTCKVPRADLRYLRMSYVDFNGEPQLGEMVVNQVIAEDVLDIFRQLYAAKFPIEKMRLIDDYDAVDEASMADNNTSAFCFRYINNTTQFSNHAAGMAVDINPLYNPFINGNYFEPKAAEPHLDRSQDLIHYIDAEDLVVQLFKEKGFVWGGDFSGRKDYQHFQMKNNLYQDLQG